MNAKRRKTVLISTNSAWNIANFRAGLIRALTALGNLVVNPDFFEAGHTDDPDVKVAGKSGVTLSYSITRHAYEFVKRVADRVFAITTDAWHKDQYKGAGHAYFEKCNFDAKPFVWTKSEVHQKRLKPCFSDQ